MGMMEVTKVFLVVDKTVVISSRCCSHRKEALISNSLDYLLIAAAVLKLVLMKATQDVKLGHSLLPCTSQLLYKTGQEEIPLILMAAEVSLVIATEDTPSAKGTEGLGSLWHR